MRVFRIKPKIVFVYETSYESLRLSSPGVVIYRSGSVPTSEIERLHLLHGTVTWSNRLLLFLRRSSVSPIRPEKITYLLLYILSVDLHL